MREQLLLHHCTVYVVPFVVLTILWVRQVLPQRVVWVCVLFKFGGIRIQSRVNINQQRHHIFRHLCDAHVPAQTAV